MTRFTSAIVLAGGSGERFSKEEKKQFYILNDIPVIIRSIQAFEDCKLINEIIVVVGKEDISLVEELISKYNIKKVSNIVTGGNTRQESALSGFDVVNPKSKFVAIHDAARCLVTEKIIKDTLYAAYSEGAAVAAEKAIDTIKFATDDGFVDSTIDRNHVWLVKTPQVFMSNMYRAAAYMAKQNNFTATDDSMLVENIGFKVKLVDCGHDNIKITTKSDISFAKSILERG